MTVKVKSDILATEIKYLYFLVPISWNCVRVWHFGSIDYLSDIENSVSLEGAMFEVYSFKYKTKIFL